MAQFTTSNSFVDFAKVTASSALSGFPASNILDYTHPNRPWKASALISTSDAIVIDFGATTAVAAVFIDATNTISLKIQGHASDSWGAPSFSNLKGVNKDLLDGRYKLYSTLSAFSYRYMRILNNATPATDGQAVWQIGSIICMSAVTDWDTNAGYPYEIYPMEETARHERGHPEPVIIDNKYVEIHMSAPILPTTAATTYQTWLAYGEGRPFVFARNYTGTGEDAYLVHRVGKTPWQQLGPNHHGVPSWVFEGVR